MSQGRHRVTFGSCWLCFTFVKGTQWYEQTKEELMAPTLLPELHLLKQVSCDLGGLPRGQIETELQICKGPPI